MDPPEERCLGAIYSATQICRESLNECTEVEELMQSQWAENRLADFNLWASGLGASVQGRASLDARLAPRPDARDAVANALQVLNDAIGECKLSGRDSADTINAASDEGHDEVTTSKLDEDPTRSFSPWSDNSEPDSELEATLNDSSRLNKAKETVNSILDLLVRIAITIRQSGTQSRLRKADRRFKVEEHDALQQHLVVVMLSQRPFSPDSTFPSDQMDPSKLTSIQWRLINCNLRRRNRFLYAQKHSEALDASPYSRIPSIETPTPEVQALPARSIGPTQAQRPSTKSVAMVTSASGITNLPGVLPAVPNGPISSHGTRTNLSTTVIKLPYPRPPKVGKDAMAFRCPCCCQTLPVDILETSRWKKHLAEDIQPYTCVLPGCSSPEAIYATKKAWESHLRDDHESADVWMCFACLDSLEFEAEDDFVAHTLQEHGETISESQIHSLTAACKTSTTAQITSCPLCAWPIVEEVEFSQIAILDHIAEHLHAFSLRALPWAPNAMPETEAAIQEATAKVEPWLVKHNLASETLTDIGRSVSAPAPSPRAPHYFDSHQYFAECSDNSSCSTVSDGTIERGLQEGPSPLFNDSDEEHDVSEPRGAYDEPQGESVAQHFNEDDLVISDDEFHLVENSEFHLIAKPDVARDAVVISRVIDGQGSNERSTNNREMEVMPSMHGEDYVWLSSRYPRQYTSFEKLSNYSFGRAIGYGKCCSVFTAESADGKVAIKTIRKNKGKGKVQEIHQEIELLQYVKHPNIARFVDWFETEDDYHIVTGLVEGGNLFDHIIEKGKLTEPNALDDLRDVLAAVGYLHHHGIVHRHLALHKFSYSTQDESSPLILMSLAHADWEKTEARHIVPTYSRMSPSKDRHFGACAPEVMRRQRSGKPADMWSIGVIACMMLSGSSPFRSKNLNDLIKECTTGSIGFHGSYWRYMSDSAKDFIQRLLQPKPEDRLTIEEALRHPWLERNEQIRSRLIRARWKSVILKVQLASKFQRFRNERNRLKGTEAAAQRRNARSRPLPQLSAIIYEFRRGKALQAVFLARMAVKEVEYLALELQQGGSTAK